MLADSQTDDPALGLMVLDKNMQPIRLPTYLKSNAGSDPDPLNLIPFRKFEEPKVYEYPRTVVTLINSQNKVFMVLPLTLTMA